MNDLLLSLVLTVIIEEIVVFTIFRRCYNLKLFINVMLINILTNLPLNYVIYMGYYRKIGLNINKYLLMGELMIVIIEILLYHFVLEENYWKCFSISLLANVVSFVVGGILINL